MRTICVVTMSRCDYGIYRPVLKRIIEEPGLKLRLIAGGTHLEKSFGYTLRAIEEDGFPIDGRVDMRWDGDTPEGVAGSMADAIKGLAKAYKRLRPDIVLLQGDRFDMLAAASAALPFNIPIAHMHGGELTEGMMDDAIRHAITKMSHLHFASTGIYAKRIIQMGEEPWRVIVSGAPSLDNLSSMEMLGDRELSAKYGINLSAHFLLATLHPLTIGFEKNKRRAQEFFRALENFNGQMLMTYPNADTYASVIIKLMRRFASKRRGVVICENLGTRDYFSLMKRASVMAGNSSSGIIEAGSFRLPVVNVGDRQSGRLRGPNVLDVDYDSARIGDAIKKALSAAFRRKISGMRNPYGDGKASERIVSKLKSVVLDEKLLLKKFYTPNPHG